MPQAPFVKPPRFAVWLMDLFTPDAICGDLLEEFSELALNSGTTLARRWYWRQSVKTIAHVIGHGYRVAPWLIAGGVLGGWLVGFCGNWLTQKAVMAVLTRYRVYAHVDPYVFWLIDDILTERLIIPVLMGYVAAVAAKGREMVAAITLSLLIGMLSGMSLLLIPRQLASWHVFGFPRPLLTALLVTTFVSPVMIAIGGGIGRKIRSAATN